MKKILFSTVALISSMIVSNVCAAPVPYVEFSSGAKTVTHTYNSDSAEETASDVSTLFDLKGLKAGQTKTEALKVKSVTKGGDKAAVSLRLEIEEADSEAEASVLDYYDFVITDNNGEVIYSSKENEKSEIEALTKDIPLGVFNTQFTTDSKTYNVDYSINEEVSAVVESIKARQVKIKAVTSDALLAMITPEPMPAVTPVEDESPSTAVPTLKPKFEIETVTPSPTPETNAPQATVTPQETELPEKDGEAKEKKEVKKVCGKDIAPGRYFVSGKGIITITGEDGVVKSSTTVTDGTVAGVNAAEGFVTSIVNGDVITVVPLDGTEKATVSFEKTNSSSNNTKTTTNKLDNKTSEKLTQKTNPKTGDMGMALGVICTLMGASAVSVAGLGILKKKKK